MRTVLRSGDERLEFREPGPAAAPGERLEFDDLRAAARWLARVLADRADALALRRLAGALARGAPPHDDRDVLARIAAAMVARRVALVRLAPPQPIAALHAPDDAPRRDAPDDFELLRQKPPETHWIEIQLLDEDGEGIPDQRCRLVSSDGVAHDGCTDGAGVARWGRLPPGACTVTFPDLERER